jgi:hypothetical protein
MQCTRPIAAVQLSDGSVLFDSQGSKNDSLVERALTASLASGGFSQRLQLRCRVCAACRSTHATMWATRLHHELSEHDTSSFITLTYSDQFLPEGGTLDHRHIQLFLKRLRFEIKKPIRYFVAGEYGDKTQRPHYHMIVYGYDFPDKTPSAIGKGGHIRYSSSSLERLWGMGLCDVGTVTDKSMSYVAYYNVKRLSDDNAMGKDLRARDFVDLQTGLITRRKPEYCRMSLRPGIGSNWFAKYKNEIHKGFLTLDGSNRAIPAFYLRKLKELFPDEYEQFILTREERMAKFPPLSAQRLDQLHDYNLTRASQITREANP